MPEKSGVDRLVLRQLEAFVVGLLRPFSVQDLEKAVAQKKLLVQMLPKDMKTRKMMVVGRNLVRKATQEELDQFNPGVVAGWVVKNRPDVLAYFEQDEVFCKWFKINIRAFRRFFGMDA